MYQAAIVEDETQILAHLKTTLSEAFQKKHISVGFDSFSSGERFLSMFTEHYHYDMIFLDIEMPGLDGIEICRHIRSIAPDTLVVFISNKEELVFQTFEVQPFRFIRKSQYQQLLPTLVNELVQQLSLNQPNMIQLTEPLSGDIFSFDIRQILYVEAQRKNCRIVTRTGESIVRCKLMDLEEQLLPHHFLKVHRSYLVNCRYIFHIGKTSLTLEDHTEIPISRGKVDFVKEQFLLYNIH